MDKQFVHNGEYVTDPRIITFPGVSVLIYADTLVSVWADGLKVPAAANYDADSLATAARLGYTSTWEMSRDHELAHHLLACAQGEPYSIVLRGVAIREAGGKKEAIISKQDSDAEEGLVLDLQRYVMLGISTPRLEQSGLDLDALAAELRSMTT